MKAQTICTNCKHFLYAKMKGHIYFHLPAYCKASPREASLKVNNITGEWSVLYKKKEKYTTEAFEKCEDVNDGHCKFYTPRDIEETGEEKILIAAEILNK